MGQAAVVLGKLEMGLRLPGPVTRAQTQVFIHAVGLHHLAWIHFPGRVPGRLELAEGLNEFRSEHARQHFGARLAVAMLARD